MKCIHFYKMEAKQIIFLIKFTDRVYYSLITMSISLMATSLKKVPFLRKSFKTDTADS